MIGSVTGFSPVLAMLTKSWSGSKNSGCDDGAADRVSSGGGSVRVVQTARVGRRPGRSVARDLPASSAEDRAGDAANNSHCSEALLSPAPTQEPARSGSHVPAPVVFWGTPCELRCEGLAACECRAEVCLAQDAGDLRALVPLNLNLAVLHRATRTAGLVHRLWVTNKPSV